MTDALNPRAFRCDPDTESLACELLRDDNPYAVRMGMLILMRRFLKTDPHLPQILAVRRSHDTLAMMTAWFLAELAIHDPEAVLDVIDTLDWATAKRLGQKVRDSRRIGQNVKDRISEACSSIRWTGQQQSASVRKCGIPGGSGRMSRTGFPKPAEAADRCR